MTIDEPMVVKGPEATVKLTANLGTSPELPALDRSPFTSIEPIKLNDDLYFVGTIFPVTDNSEAHMVGLMGGMTVWPTQIETRLYKSSIEYFKAFAMSAKSDIGLAFHSQEADFAALRLRKSGESNPIVIEMKNSPQ